MRKPTLLARLRIDPLLLSLAGRNILRNRVRSTLALLAIALSTAAIVLASGFIEDIFVGLGEHTIRSQLGHIQILGKSPDGATRPIIADPGPAHAELATIAEVQTVLDRLRFSGLLNNGRSDYPINGEGVEPGKESSTSTQMRIIAGRSLVDTDTHGILLGAGVAQALELAPGDNATLLVSTPDGAMNSLDVEVIGVFRTMSRDFDARAVRIQIGSARDLLVIEGATSIVVFLDETRKTRAVANYLIPRLEKDGLDVKRWDELADFYQKTVDLYNGLLAVMKTIAIGAVLLSVINCVSLGIHERTREFGTLRALGNRNRDVYVLIVIESALLGMAGSTLGCILGGLAGWALTAIGIPMPPPPNSDVGYIHNILVTPGALVQTWAFGCFASVLGGLIAGRRASKLEISEALRHAA
jgi:putative ABC transport system permease protein